MTCRPSQRVGDADALPYEASVKYTREEPGGRAFPRVVYQGAYTCMSPLPFSCEKSLMVTPVTVFASSVEPDSCLQFDSSFMKKHTYDFLFMRGARHLGRKVETPMGNRR